MQTVDIRTGRRQRADLTVVVPTFNEADNVEALVDRVAAACPAVRTEVLFVDDSTDHTPDVIRRVMTRAPIRVRMIHRMGAQRTGGLSGAVTRGLAAAEGSTVVVMDGDLQHPPELVPVLHAALHDARGRNDVVVASRYCGDGDASGLSDAWRRAVSSGSTALARIAFPRRVGRHCTDPMTGFFAVRRSSVQLDRLRPRGFKILLEILARHDLHVAEVPFVFGDRLHGESKAGWRQGAQFASQLMRLRLGRVGGFAAVGAIGTLVNLGVMAGLIASGTGYLVAALVAAEVSILGNVWLQERFVFADGGSRRRSPVSRVVHSVVFNNLEAALRLPLLVLLVEWLLLDAVLAQASTIGVAFVVRYLYVARVVHRRDPVPVGDTGPAPVPAGAVA